MSGTFLVSQYDDLIVETDKLLSALRPKWMEAREEDKAQWMKRINTCLDERFRLTSAREAAAKIEA